MWLPPFPRLSGSPMLLRTPARCLLPASPSLPNSRTAELSNAFQAFESLEFLSPPTSTFEIRNPKFSSARCPPAAASCPRFEAPRTVERSNRRTVERSWFSSPARCLLPPGPCLLPLFPASCLLPAARSHSALGSRLSTLLRYVRATGQLPGNRPGISHGRLEGGFLSLSGVSHFLGLRD
jgi:hypothetical protein